VHSFFGIIHAIVSDEYCITCTRSLTIVFGITVTRFYDVTFYNIIRQEGEYICEQLAATNRLHCMDLVEVNPTLSDGNGTRSTAEMAISLLQHATGRKMESELFIRPNPYTPEGSRNVHKK